MVATTTRRERVRLRPGIRRGVGLPLRVISCHIPQAMSFDRERIQEKAASVAVQGVYLGTSSWKYEGWLGQLYTAERYEYRGKIAKSRFERDCLRRTCVERDRPALPMDVSPSCSTHVPSARTCSGLMRERGRVIGCVTAMRPGMRLEGVRKSSAWFFTRRTRLATCRW